MRTRAVTRPSVSAATALTAVVPMSIPIMTSLRDILGKFDSMRDLEQAALDLEKLAREQQENYLLTDRVTRTEMDRQVQGKVPAAQLRTHAIDRKRHAEELEASLRAAREEWELHQAEHEVATAGEVPPTLAHDAAAQIERKRTRKMGR